MSRRKKNLPLIDRAEVVDIAKGGKAIARKEDLVILVSHAVPGDVIDIQVTRKKKKFYEGKPVRFHTYSPYRTRPVCSHFPVCGGCKWQDMTYEAQLKYKEKQVTDQMQRLAGLSDEIHNVMLPILPADTPWYYRNKLEFTFSAKRWLTPEEIASGKPITEPALGFHIAGLFDKILNITDCHLQPEPSNAIRNFIRDFTMENGYPYFNIREQKGLMRNLIIRTTLTGEVMVILSFFEDNREKITRLLDTLRDRFPEITSLQYVINPKGNDTLEGLEVKVYHGKDHIVEKLDGLSFKISPKSFFQTNTRQAANLYRTVLEFAGITVHDTVYDLYSGTGTIGLFLASHARKVIGIENITEAVADALENARLNHIENATFITGDTKELFNESLFREQGHPDVVILDPPRAGIHPEIIRMLFRQEPRRIVYVSCNPATQARDIQSLMEKYTPEKIQPVDMFPHTDHIENVVMLERNRKG